MSIQKVVIKIHTHSQSSHNPEDFVATFNDFIVNRSIQGGLIDVADYSHMHNGLGVLLTTHEANWSFDEQYNQPGIMVVEKGFAANPVSERFTQWLDSIIKVCKTIEETPRHKGIKFDYQSISLVLNDRSEKAGSLEDLKTIFEQAVKELYDSNEIDYDENFDPAKRVGFLAKIKGNLKD